MGDSPTDLASSSFAEGGVPETGAVYVELKTGSSDTVYRKGGSSEFTMVTWRLRKDVKFYQLSLRVALSCRRSVASPSVKENFIYQMALNKIVRVINNK